MMSFSPESVNHRFIAYSDSLICNALRFSKIQISNRYRLKAVFSIPSVFQFGWTLTFIGWMVAEVQAGDQGVCGCGAEEQRHRQCESQVGVGQSLSIECPLGPPLKLLFKPIKKIRGR
jgi:hypothetical protein